MNRREFIRNTSLAAEFPSNPFSAAFAKVDAAVAAKQDYETKEVQKLFRGGRRDKRCANSRKQRDEHGTNYGSD